MKIIQLIHAKKLKYAMPNELPPLILQDIEQENDAVIVSFRKSAQRAPHIVKKDFHACQRLLDVPQASTLILAGIEKDSPLAPLILWDIVHTLTVGTKIIVLDVHQSPSYLERTYFSNALQLTSQDNNKKVFMKVAPLPIEQEKGLDRWSFGIPVGPGDAAGLNVIVKRILELDIPEKEIILCGRPGKNFKYWDKVRIVGEDIPAPPIRITLKKNTLARAAKFENLCILHDRVFLPTDFYQGMLRFGDLYPFVALQSIFFLDRNNFLPCRYSDYHRAADVPAITTLCEDGRYNAISSETLATINKARFFSANPYRYSLFSYATGSLYICKKSLWLSMPQNEMLDRDEFEDMEHGQRAGFAGIPERVNPYLFTQSIYARSTILGFSSVAYETSDGAIQNVRTRTRSRALSIKPFYRVSAEEARSHLHYFATRYLSESNQVAVLPHIAQVPKNAKDWVFKVGMVLSLAKISRNLEAVKTYLTDVEKHILFENLHHPHKEYTLNEFHRHGTSGKAALFENYWLWIRLLMAGKKQRSLFCKEMKAFFHPRNFKTRIGSMISAYFLNRKNKELFYHPDGLTGYYRAIVNSTPFQDYLDPTESL